MARGSFSTSNYLQLVAAPVAAVPLTMACWFRVGSGGNWQSLINLNNPTAANGRNAFSLMRNDGNQIQIDTADGSSGVSATAGTVTTGAWHHAGGVFSAVNSRRAYFNGVGGSVESSSRTPSGLGRTTVGAKNNNGSVIDASGNALIAEAAIWNVALSDEEMALLAKGIAPSLIRPQALVAYLPLVRDLIDLKNPGWASVGTVAVADHLRVLQAA